MSLVIKLPAARRSNSYTKDPGLRPVTPFGMDIDTFVQHCTHATGGGEENRHYGNCTDFVNSKCCRKCARHCEVCSREAGSFSSIPPTSPEEKKASPILSARRGSTGMLVDPPSPKKYRKEMPASPPKIGGAGQTRAMALLNAAAQQTVKASAGEGHGLSGCGAASITGFFSGAFSCVGTGRQQQSA